MATRGYENFTQADVTRRSLKQQPRAKVSKYHAVKTIVDGITFDSAKEARRYSELKLLEKAGEITDLELQPVYELHAPNGERLGSFLADFKYRRRDGSQTIEDVKGMKTLALARWKQKHCRAEYAITVVEIR